VPESSPPGRRGKGRRSSSAPKKASSAPEGGAAGRKGRGRLSAEAITEAAIRIADAEGLEAVSIRRVAAELDARPMSLYDHISSKDELLFLMVEEGNRMVLVEKPLPEDWREAVTAIATRMYEMFVEHPWFVFAYLRRPSFGPNSKRLAKQMIRSTESLPLEPGEVWGIQGSVNDYVLGHSFRAVAPVRAQSKTISESDVVEFPELDSLRDYMRSRSSKERFEYGLQIVLDGVEEQIRRRS
jgi:AcrR family transcriptional regulator